MVPDLFSFDALPSPEPILVSLGQPLAWFRAPFPTKELYRRGQIGQGSLPDFDMVLPACNYWWLSH
jgi:hypothetical protein